MKAIVLSAGKGERLRPKTHNLPKALVRVLDRALIDYTLSFLFGMKDIEEIIIVGGFQFDLLERYIEDCYPKYRKRESVDEKRFRVLFNPDFEQGSILTVMKALPFLEGDSFLLMNVDHIYPLEFRRRIESVQKKGMIALCDFDRTLGKDDMKIVLSKEARKEGKEEDKKEKEGRTIQNIDKKLSSFDGGYIGMFLCHADCLLLYQNYVEKTLSLRGKHCNVEAVIQLIAQENENKNEEIGVLDCSSSRWYEVDDLKDLKNTEEQLKSRLDLYCISETKPMN